MADDVIWPHVGDHGYWLVLVDGDPHGVVDWAGAVFELVIERPRPSGDALAPASGDVDVDRAGKRLRWRPASGDLDRPGDYRWQVADIRAGMRRTLRVGTFTVEAVLRRPPLPPA